MGCPSGWSGIGSCKDKYSCDSVKCGNTTNQWRHVYVRCQKDGSTTSDCYWEVSYYAGCC
ncbi:hypothetical protein J5TS2_00800 [Brevibacillus halotolerans]|nr:hypothetical protein J5TS2_00800 [Brevibacillus halotolerans]